ncbi:hypothetical protein D4764_13G0000260 [Takifugu flavidus]|uniref:Uncharacterized protein n=1 Tax=Takifugu flavidus TaxID=433684 RepID=A0A5C6P6C7_9TELE|nr:hypothetical protein D4764_13G0000260 [Takifugu flavidus]
MALAYSAVTQLGLFSQQYPPPLLPKPRKDNMRLQKLLKRNAKKKTSAQGSQTATYFRSSLSPVDEASPDLEHSDRSTPPKTPETQFRLDNPHQPPRITTMVIPSCSQNVSTVSTDLGPQLETFRIFAPELPGKTVQGVEMKKAVVDVYSRMPTASDAAAEPKHASLVSPAVVEVARAKTSHIVTQTVAEFKFNEAELNGDINSDMTPAATPIHQSLTKSEPDLTGAVKPATPADSQLSSTQKSMGMKSKVSGWSRLKKHMVVEQEEPKFPETDFNTEANEQSHGGKEQTEGMNKEWVTAIHPSIHPSIHSKEPGLDPKEGRGEEMKP